MTTACAVGNAQLARKLDKYVSVATSSHAVSGDLDQHTVDINCSHSKHINIHVYVVQDLHRMQEDYTRSPFDLPSQQQLPPQVSHRVHTITVARHAQQALTLMQRSRHTSHTGTTRPAHIHIHIEVTCLAHVRIDTRCPAHFHIDPTCPAHIHTGVPRPASKLHALGVCCMHAVTEHAAEGDIYDPLPCHLQI